MWILFMPISTYNVHNCRRSSSRWCFFLLHSFKFLLLKFIIWHLSSRLTLTCVRRVLLLPVQNSVAWTLCENVGGVFRSESLMKRSLAFKSYRLNGFLINIPFAGWICSVFFCDVYQTKTKWIRMSIVICNGMNGEKGVLLMPPYCHFILTGSKKKNKSKIIRKIRSWLYWNLLCECHR